MTNNPSGGCGCAIEYTQGSSGEDYHIEYCPLHLHAWQMLDALKGIIEIGKRDMTNPKYDGYFDAVREVIKAAQGKA